MISPVKLDESCPRFLTALTRSPLTAEAAERRCRPLHLVTYFPLFEPDIAEIIVASFGYTLDQIPQQLLFPHSWKPLLSQY